MSAQWSSKLNCDDLVESISKPSGTRSRELPWLMVRSAWRADAGLINVSDSVTGNCKELWPRPMVPKYMKLGRDRKIPRDMVFDSGRCLSGCGRSIL